MFFIDYPYVSSYLAQYLENSQYPVVETPEALRLLAGFHVNYISLEEAEERLRESPLQPLYTNSENALAYISGWEFWLPAAASAGLCKNKASFREHIKQVYPDFFFKKLSLSDLETIEDSELPYPCIIKPSLGFFSLNVHLVEHREAWGLVREKIIREAEQINRSYPSSVVASSDYIIEECIEGEEYAVDAYYDAQGEPVLLGIYKHLFSSAADMSDRVYVTSASIRTEVYDMMFTALKVLNVDNSFRVFPVHAELRISEKHGCIPIEINPLRFGGWCTTADLAGFAGGMQQYEVFMQQDRPDILHTPEVGEDLFSIIVLDNSTGIPADQLAGISLERLSEHLTEILEYRPVSLEDFGVFGFVFARTPKEKLNELYEILHSDLREFVVQKG
jgi:hypothetical protein